MSENTHPIAITAAEVAVRNKPSVYPEPFASRMAGREKHPLGDFFGLTNFGVNLTRLAPNGLCCTNQPDKAKFASNRHHHTLQ